MKYVQHEVRDRIGIVTLSRPEALNALNDGLMDELSEVLLEWDRTPDIGVIVITGSERAFAAGADIQVMAGWSYTDVSESQFITRNWETIRQIRKPLIAAVAGFAVGGGCELALACDIIIAAESAQFSLPEIKLALLPGAGGTQRLPRTIGKAKAMDMCLSARTLNAAQADQYGLVSRVVPSDQLMEQTLTLAQRISSFSLPALIAIKESVNRAWESPLGEGILFERRALYARFASQDTQEGIQAFLNKRTPAFKHC